MSKAVILDAYTTNPGDLKWDVLVELFDKCLIYDRTNQQEIAERIRDADYVFTNKVSIEKEHMATATKLKYIGVMATGYDIIDLETAGASNITVTNVPDYSTDSVAQLTFAMILAHTNQVAELNESVQAGDWIKSQDFSYWHQGIIELKGKYLGLIGFGSIAKQVAKIGRAFGMKVLVYNRSTINVEQDDIKQVAFDDLLIQADFISIHLPLAENTHHLIDETALNKMKQSAILINTARGPIIEERALFHALNEGKIAGAGIDVLNKEPMEDNHFLLGVPNLYITPHVAWASVEARNRLIEILANNVKQFINNQPVNTVNR